MARNPIHGFYHIVETEAWDEEYLNEEQQAFMRLGRGGRGEFHFGYVHGIMDCRYEDREGVPSVQFSWEGNDEHHPAFGRGEAILEDGKLVERIFIHDGDDSGFVAKKAPSAK